MSLNAAGARRRVRAGRVAALPGRHAPLPRCSFFQIFKTSKVLLLQVHGAVCERDGWKAFLDVTLNGLWTGWSGFQDTFDEHHAHQVPKRWEILTFTCAVRCGPAGADSKAHLMSHAHQRQYCTLGLHIWGQLAALRCRRTHVIDAEDLASYP